MAAPDKDTLLSALWNAGGIITHVADAFGVDRRTVYNWTYHHGITNDELMEMREATCDLAELSLRANLLAHKEASTIFTLKTLGRKRGYSEHQDTMAAVLELMPLFIKHLSPEEEKAA